MLNIVLWLCSAEVCLSKGCDGCCIYVCFVRRGVAGARVFEVGVFRHAYVVYLCLVSCVHSVTILNDAFYMTSSLLMLVEDARGDHIEETYSRAGLMTVL